MPASCLSSSCRPEFQHSWFKHANVTMHSLTRLSRSEVSGMVTDLLRGGSIPGDVLDELIAKADGVPLFIEELTSSIASNEQTAQSATLRVPETLHDALMERLDRVAPGQRVAQIAAAIGREFSYDLLSAASRIDDNRSRFGAVAARGCRHHPSCRYFASRALSVQTRLVA